MEYSPLLRRIGLESWSVQSGKCQLLHDCLPPSFQHYFSKVSCVKNEHIIVWSRDWKSSKCKSSSICKIRGFIKWRSHAFKSWLDFGELLYYYAMQGGGRNTFLLSCNIDDIARSWDSSSFLLGWWDEKLIKRKPALALNSELKRANVFIMARPLPLVEHHYTDSRLFIE